MLLKSYVHKGVFRAKCKICDGAFLAPSSHGLFLKKYSLVDFVLGSTYASASLDAPCEIVQLKFYFAIFMS